MRTSMEHLPGARQVQLCKIINVIVKFVRPEKIILHGVYGGDWTGPDLGEALQYPLGFDLLIVTRKGERRQDFELQDLIENRCKPIFPVNVLAHDIEYVNMRLREGQYFFSMLVREGILLYDAGYVPLASVGVVDLSAVRAMAQLDFEKWHQRAAAFYKSAVMNMEDQQYRVAVFLLHQTAEQAYQAILLVYMGYKPCTHNLDKLRRHTNRLSIELVMLFPRDSENEDHLFRLLQQAYVDARYKDDYRISAEEVSMLVERMGCLLSITERVCRNRFVSLEKMASTAVTGR